MAQQSEANYFALHLPALAPALRDKLEKWGSRECRQRSIEPEGEGVNIYVERKAKTTALKLQRNVRGIAANSGAPLPPTLGKGWLVPLSPEEWNARVAETPAVPEPPFPRKCHADVARRTLNCQPTSMSARMIFCANCRRKL